MTKRGTERFADGDVHVLRQIDPNSKSTAFVVLPGLLPTMQSWVFFLECIAGETRVIKSVYPAVFTKFRKYPFLTRFNPFLARCDLVCPGLAQKHRRFATVSARGCRGATNRLRPTSKGSTTHTRSNLISIRDQHTTGLGSVITAYHDET